MPQIKRAIISVTNKAKIVELGQCLQQLNVEILSTGGTAKTLREHNIPVIDVSEYTGFPECMDGRLKTLHPKVEGGILGMRSNGKHVADMQKLQIPPIDMVVVNLYDFAGAISDPTCTKEHAIENVDIGGPTMLRAAAKNYQDVTVLVDPNDYQCIIEELKTNKGVIAEKTNYELALKVFETTSRYDGLIAQHLKKYSSSKTDGFPEKFSLFFEKIQDLRYGENPHQKAIAYREIPHLSGTLGDAKQIHGKELSFNNLLDLESALNLVREFEDPACAIIKHTNPCGCAVGKNLKEAFIKAKEGDPVSSFGGIIGLNREVDEECAKLIGETFFECIIAPKFSEAALKILTSKKNIRLMVLQPFDIEERGALDFKRISGGLLVQEKDVSNLNLATCQVPTKRKPSEQEWFELDFAWRVVKHIKSNAIVFTKGGQILGVGAGQMSRVDSVKIAAQKAGKPLAGSVVASDAFFPFRDGLDEAAKHGITAVVQPGGSVRDEEVIKCADEFGLAMVFSNMRHFKH